MSSIAYIKLHCPTCGERLRARPEVQGKRAKCKGCGGKVLVPPKDAEETLIEPVEEEPLVAEVLEEPEPPEEIPVVDGPPEEEEPLPRKPRRTTAMRNRKSKRPAKPGSKLPWIIGGSVAALVLVVGIVIVIATGGKKKNEDVAAGPPTDPGSSAATPPGLALPSMPFSGGTDASSLIGYWEPADGPGDIVIQTEFRRNGKVVTIVINPGNKREYIEGNYSFDGKKLTISVEGLSDTMTVTRLTAAALEYTMSDGTRIEMKRAKPR